MIPYNELTALYVAPTGASAPPPDREPVFPSIDAALAFVKGLRRVGVDQPLSIRLGAGTHRLYGPVRIDGDVTGITVEPDGDAEVRLIGGKKIENWERGTYNGAPCFSAPLPGGCDFTDLYVNGERAKLTRYPAEGWLYADDVENHDGQLFSSSKWFIAREGDFKDFKNIDRVQISFCHYWIDEHTPLESYDPDSRRVTMLYPSRFNIAGDRGSASALEYCLENVAETFGNPDEWYADGERIYYVPRDPSMMPEDIEAYAPRIHKLFELCGTPEKPVKNVRIRGIRMGVTRGEYGSLGQGASGEGEPVRYASDAQAVAQADGAVSFRYAENCSIEDCALENYGLHGVVVWQGCHGIALRRTLFRDGGAGGVKIIGGPSGSPLTERTFGNTVEDCRIEKCGRRYFAACGVLVMHSYENTIAHNEISQLYYTGVSVGWVWGYGDSVTRDNRIEKNHIHHLGAGMLSDMGGVYLLGKQPGTVVSGNVIHHVRSKNYGGWALYTDEGSSYITLENNICYACSDNAYHQHYGSMNTVRNNIFALSGGQEIRVSRSEPHLSILFENNILYANGDPFFALSSEQIERRTVSSKKNLVWDLKGEPVWCGGLSLAEAKERGFEFGTVLADPKFADPENGDFTLDEDSPAFELGFRPISVSDVGPRA